MVQVSGGELVARTLAAADVTHAFVIHGGHLEAIFQGFLENDIAVVDARDEAAAGHAAEGYACSRRTLGVALATAGPGITNVITSIANAYHNRTPVLYLTASAALAHTAVNMVQADIDNVALARPVTKWAHRITVTADIPRLVAQAIRVATCGPTGPVLLEIPLDVSFGMIDEALAPIPRPICVDVAPGPRAGAVDEAVRLLAGARRPVIMAGEGAWQSGAGAELRTFAEASGIPVFAHYQSQGLLSADHPLYGGTFFKMAELNEPGNRPDVILALGTRFGVFTLGGGDRIVPAQAAIIHVEVDPTEIGRVRGVDVPVVADSLEFLRALNAATAGTAWPDLAAWRGTVEDARVAREKRLADLLSHDTTPIHPYQAASGVLDALAPDALVIGDGAEAHQWLVEAARPRRPDSYFTHGHFACLGFGLGFAVGAQTAFPERQVLLVTGDGGVGFTIAEFDTMARHRLPIVVVVMNNRAWGATRHLQEIFSGGRYTATELADTRYEAVAAAFGCQGRRVTDLAELRPAVEEAFASKQPTCINVAIGFTAMPPDAELLMSTF
jgi:acetolactate synthase I/II/III large subunit